MHQNLGGRVCVHCGALIIEFIFLHIITTLTYPSLELESEKISALGCIFSVRNKTFLFNIYSRLISDFTEDFLKV